MLQEDLADAAEVLSQAHSVVAPKKDIVNDHAGAVDEVDHIDEEALSEIVPFALQHAHHSGVDGWSVPRAEGKDSPSILLAVGAEERELVRGCASNLDLMEALPAID